MPALAIRQDLPIRCAAAAGMPPAGPPCRHAAHGDRSCARRLLACRGRPACGHGVPGAVAAGSASSSGMHTCAHSGRCQPHDQCRRQQGCRLHSVEGRVRPPHSLSRTEIAYTIGPACRTARKLPLGAAHVAALRLCRDRRHGGAHGTGHPGAAGGRCLAPRSAIITALADRHPKEDVIRTLMRLAVTGQLVETERKYSLAPASET